MFLKLKQPTDSTNNIAMSLYKLIRLSIVCGMVYLACTTAVVQLPSLLTKHNTTADNL